MLYAFFCLIVNLRTTYFEWHFDLELFACQVGHMTHASHNKTEQVIVVSVHYGNILRK